MPSRTIHPPTPSVIDSDRATLRALKDLPTYAPHNQAHSTEALIAREAALTTAEMALVRARIAYDTARIELNRVAWAFHDDTVCARQEVKTQFGADSHEVRAVGLKRSSERKRPTRRARPAASS
ncbi:MAG: hypothetical protein HGA45_29345 [Chloroflexales bacterium]|nr:hypothetical protein [Chloroflexales bacterium]